MIKEHTGPRYLMHWCWSRVLGHFARLTSLPSPTSNLHFNQEEDQYNYQLKTASDHI